MTVIPEAPPELESDGPGRAMPQDVEAERSVLGAMLLSPDAVADVVGTALRAEDFYRPEHELIYAGIVDMFGRGEPVDVVTVAADLLQRQILGQVGGPAYIARLSQAVPSATNAAFYAGIVADKAELRRVIRAGTQAVDMAYAQQGDARSITAAAQAAMLSVTEQESRSENRSLADIVEATLDEVEAAGNRSEALTGVPTGFVDLDRLTNGLHPGQMIVIAARPAVGKSTVGLDIARSAAIHHGIPTAVFSLEMSDTEIGMRLLSAEARVPLQNLRRGLLREEEWERLASHTEPLNEAPLHIHDAPNLTPVDIRARCRRLQQQGGLGLVVVDYLQLMTSGRRVENRQQEVSGFSRLFKLLAKELGAPVIAISQLNRGPEQRTDKRPQMSDLRESGSIEQDADVVILLHREDMYDKDSPRAGEADFIVAKHRNGPTDTITVAFQGHYSRFVDMAS